MASDDPVAIDEPGVTGVIVLPDGAELPADATWSVELQDTSEQDVAAETMGKDAGSAEDVAMGEIPFVVNYDPESIDERFQYTLSARIVDADDTLLYINDTVTPGIVDGEPLEDVEIVTIDVQAQASEAEAMPAEAEESPEA